MNAGEAFGPCAAEEFGEDGLGLVIEGVSGDEGVKGDVAEKLAEPGVAKAAGGAFEGVGSGRADA